MMSWTKIGLVAAVLAGAVQLVAAEPVKDEKVERKGPLAGLPSAPGLHMEKIKALGDGQWVNIGKAAPDPKWGPGTMRSWGSKMPYAPELGGAFVSGQGPHGMVKANGYYDDVFFYDLYAHRWICLYPGINTRTFVEDIKSGEIKIGDKGYMVYKDGQPVHACGGHTYQWHAYNPDRHEYVFGGWPGGLPSDQHLKAAGAPWYLEARKLLEPQLAALPKDRPSVGGYCYDTTTGKMSREAPSGMIYIPNRKAFWTYYDQKTFVGGDVKAKGSLPPCGFYDFGACYDSKRDRIYMGRMPYTGNPGPDEGHWWIYDLATNTWSHPPNKLNAVRVPATNSGVTHYDTVNDRVVTMYNYDGDLGVSVWDPETYAWEPKAAFPIPNNVGIAGFYSPELNAHFVHAARDAAAGDFWVYRYKKAAEKK